MKRGDRFIHRGAFHGEDATGEILSDAEAGYVTVEYDGVSCSWIVPLAKLEPINAGTLH